MKANPDKYYSLVNINKESCQINIGNKAIALPKANMKNYEGLN